MIHQTEVIENNMYACIYLDEFNSEKEYAELLLRHCKDEQFEITGDYICEVLTELPMTKSHKREMFLRLQIPVTFVKK